MREFCLISSISLQKKHLPLDTPEEEQRHGTCLAGPALITDKQAFEGAEPKGKRKMNQVEKTPFEAERISDSPLSEGLPKSPDKGLVNPLLYNEVRLPRPTKRS